jgi:hypothetical protein
MGTLASALTQISTTIGTLNAISSGAQQLTGRDNRTAQRSMRLQQDQAMRALEQDQVQSQAELERTAKAEREQIVLQADQDATRRRNALKRSMAKQNALRGAGGTSTSGSAEAVLLGLVNDTEDDNQNRKQLDQIRYNAIDNDVYTLNQRNILEQQQLSDRHRLDRAISDF